MTFAHALPDLLAALPDAQVEGAHEAALKGIASLNEAGPDDLSFLANRKYTRDVPNSRAGVILVPKDYTGNPAPGQAFVRVANPSLALALICERLLATQQPRPQPGIHPSAIVDPTATVDPQAHIGPLCVIEAGARIAAEVVLVAQVYVGSRCEVGPQTTLQSGVRLYADTLVGARCLLHAGAVLGADGFGFESGPQGHRKVPQVGRVVVEDDVEIGANSTIDRARFSETRIGRGTKIDNLVQIGHNCRIGSHCLLCAQVGLAGSLVLGDFVVFAGQAGSTGHVHIGSYTQVGGQAGVSKDWPAKSIVTGSPAQEFQAEKRLQALLRRLPDLFQRVRALEQQLPALAGREASESSPAAE